MAFNTIKGLTVEIGGDTTKLGKALEDVNKKSRDLSGELGEINRMLKLDPGNTDLLTQKQKVLADAVENTSEKLKKLKEAEKQVQAQFKRGEVSEEQVRALQREIVATEQKMDSYEDAIEETEKALKGMDDETENVEKSSGKLGKALGSAAKVGLQLVATAATAAITGLIASAEATREYRTEMGKLKTAFTQNGFTAEAATGAYKELQGVLGETDQAVEAANHLAKLTDNEKDLATWTGDILPGVFATFGASLPIEGLTEAANETAKVGKVTGPLADALNWAGVSEDAFNESLAACTTEQERQALITETLSELYGDAAAAYKKTNAEVIRANKANEAWMDSMADVGAVVEPIITDVKMMGAAMLSDLVPGIQQLATSFRSLLNGDTGAAAGIGAALSGIITQLMNKVTELAPALTQVAVSLITTLSTTIITMLPQLIETGVQLISTIITGITQALPQIVDAFVGMIPVLVAALPGMIQSLVTALLGLLPVIIEGVIALAFGLVEALPQILAALLPMIPQIITDVCSMLAEQLPVLLDATLKLIVMLVTEIRPQMIKLIWESIPQVLQALLDGLITIYNSIKAKLEAWDKAIAEWFANIWTGIKEWAANLWSRFTTWIGNLVKKAGEAGQKFLTTVVDFFKQLPSKIWEWLKSTLSKVTSWASDLVAKGKEAASKLLTTVVNGVKELPSKMLNIGKDLVRGLWKGISDMIGWVKDKISGFADNVLEGIKSFFGVNSPSKETAWIGEMLDKGLAAGITKNAKGPLDAMAALSGDLLDEANGVDGLTLDRRINANFGADAAAAQNGLGAMLDKILAAIERGQVLTIDGDQLVGATAAKYDNTLGQRRALAARGAV